MKIIIIGATGTLGQHVVNQALAQGHQVTAFARNPSTLQVTHGDLTPHAGNVLNAAVVRNAIKDHDAVVITLGAGMKGSVRATGTQHVIDAMAHHGIRRLICLSTLGAGNSRDHLNFFWKYIMFGLLLRKALADHEAQETIVKKSDADWIIVRPAAFTDGPATGAYRHGFPRSATGLKLKISRADVAAFMVGGFTDDTYLGELPGLSY